MPRYQVKVDPSLDVKMKAFGARVDDKSVFIPSSLAQALRDLPLGDDAATVAVYLASFPMSVASSLGLTPSAVIKAAGALITLLEESGADVSSAHRRGVTRRVHGARHPGNLD